MTRFPQLAQRLTNAPLLIHPDKAQIVMAAVAAQLGIGRINGIEAAEAAAAADSGFARPGATIRRGYSVVAGVAVIQIQGTLVQRLGTLTPYSGMTGYDGIRENILTALQDPEARAIVLDIDSPGGEVAGCFDLVDQIHALRGRKPMWSILAEGAYSAAYAIASATDRITVPRTGGAGSIGAITMLVDWSKAMATEGVAVHFVHYGARKAEESRARYEGVSADLLARVQADIDAIGEIFVGAVARNRAIDPAALRAQQAACFMGGAAVAQRLADAVMAPDEAFRALLATLDQ